VQAFSGRAFVVVCSADYLGYAIDPFFIFRRLDLIRRSNSEVLNGTLASFCATPVKPQTFLAAIGLS
jgi:hypothetical protein